MAVTVATRKQRSERVRERREKVRAFLLSHPGVTVPRKVVARKLGLTFGQVAGAIRMLYLDGSIPKRERPRRKACERAIADGVAKGLSYQDIATGFGVSLGYIQIVAKGMVSRGEIPAPVRRKPRRKQASVDG